MHEVLANRLGGLSLPRNSVVRLTDSPEMTLDVYRGRKTTIQQQQQLSIWTSSGKGNQKKQWGPESFTWVNRHSSNSKFEQTWKFVNVKIWYWLKIEEWSWPLLQKDIHVLIYLTVFVIFCTKIFCNELLLYECQERKFNLAIKISRSILGHLLIILGQKSNSTFEQMW